VQKEKNFFACL
jgi:hypothetical protein